MLSIDNHVTLKTESLKKLSLCLRSSPSHGNNSLRLDSVDRDLELFDLNINELPLALDLKFELFLNQSDLILILLFNKLKVRGLLDPLRVHLKLRLVDLRLRLDQVSLGLCLRVGYRQARGAHALVLGLELPEVLVHLLVLDLALDVQAL